MFMRQYCTPHLIAIPQITAERKFNPSTLVEALSDFSDWLLVKQGLQTSTITGCLRVISKVLRDLDTLNPTEPQVTRYVVALHRRGCSHSHISNNCLAFERYSDFQGSPIRLGRPKKPKWRIKTTSILTEAEIAVLLAACKNVRELAIMATLAYSGIRNHELSGLKVRDVEFGNNILYINHGKGDKYRPVCGAGECIEIIQRYLEQFPRSADERFFTALRSGKRFTPWAARRLCKVVASRTKIDPKHVYPHNFRHSLANNWLGREASLLAVQGQLGHAHISTTMIYVAPSFKRQQAEYNLRAPSYL